MEAIIGILAVVGLVALVLAAIGWWEEQQEAVPPEEDRAAPYREGLHAAIRLQTAAQDMEQQLYAEAMRHAAGEPPGEP